jgi:hypothetical protein
MAGGLDDARRAIQDWRQDYDQVRPYLQGRDNPETTQDANVAAPIPAHRRVRGGRLILAFLLVAGLVLLRLIHLEADGPAGISWSAGLYVDEGNETPPIGDRGSAKAFPPHGI